jgi:hypothetical protein
MGPVLTGPQLAGKRNVYILGGLQLAKEVEQHAPKRGRGRELTSKAHYTD